MEALRERLDQLREHYHDRRWLAAHADTLYSVLEVALNTPQQVNDAIEALIAICPYMFTRSDFKRWASLLFDALINAQLLQDNELQTRIWAQIGEGYYLAGQCWEARKAFETALERAQQGRTHEMMLAAYTGMIRLQSLWLDAAFNAEFVREVLALSRAVDDLALRGRLHRVLATIYTHRGKTCAALGHGQIAYAAWFRLKDPLEMARAAFVLADTYRMAQCIAQAERCLGLAAALFAQAEYAPAFCLVAYEGGILYLERQEYEAAQQWFTISLQEALKIERPYDVAMSHHSLAIAQIGLKRFQDAEANLKKALSTWEALGHCYYQAHAYQAYGYLEGQRGAVSRALQFLQRGLEICAQIPDSSMRQLAEGRIRDTIAELQ